MEANPADSPKDPLASLAAALDCATPAPAQPPPTLRLLQQHFLGLLLVGKRRLLLCLCLRAALGLAFAAAGGRGLCAAGGAMGRAL